LVAAGGLTTGGGRPKTLGGQATSATPAHGCPVIPSVEVEQAPLPRRIRWLACGSVRKEKIRGKNRRDSVEEPGEVASQPDQHS
jgi:hypothetical protein